MHTIEELHIKQRWEKNRIFESAKVLIGKKAGEVILKELQERKGQCLRVVVPMKLIEGVSDSVLKENVYV